MARQTHVTPKAQLHWAMVLGKPRTNKSEPDKPASWSVEVHIPIGHPDALTLTQVAEEAFLEAHGNAAKVSKNGWPFSEVLDESDQPTGVLRFRFSRNATNKDRSQEFSPPTVIDASKALWPQRDLIGNGSMGKVAFTTFAWKDSYGKAGISFGLEGVQVLDFKPYAGGSALAAFAEEDGYVAAAAKAAEEEGPFAAEEEIPF